ncbi:MAG: sulfur oxidation c-type cytochrome SoxX [Burkholderiaceae bacterium]
MRARGLFSALTLAAGGCASMPVPDPAAAEVAADGIATPLTALPGRPDEGRRIVADRQLGLCLLCHSGPFPEVPFQGDIATDLAGAGSRWNTAQLRLRLIDPARLNPNSLMPAYGRSEGFARTGEAWRGRPVLQRQQIEDVVAFLATLRTPP